MRGGGEGERGESGGFLERLRAEREPETLARLMAALVAEPEFLLEPGERWMR